MILVSIYDEIYSRLTGDSTLMTYITGVFDNYFSPNQTMPFLVVDFGDAFTDDAFKANQSEVTVRVSLYASKQPASSVTSAAILARVYGNSASFPTLVPTYGLHRWVSGSSTGGWAITGGTHVRDYQAHEADFYHWIQEFKLRAFQVYTAPTPP